MLRFLRRWALYKYSIDAQYFRYICRNTTYLSKYNLEHGGNMKQKYPKTQCAQIGKKIANTIQSAAELLSGFSQGFTKDRFFFLASQCLLLSGPAWCVYWLGYKCGHKYLQKANQTLRTNTMTVVCIQLTTKYTDGSKLDQSNTHRKQFLLSHCRSGLTQGSHFPSEENVVKPK